MSALSRLVHVPATRRSYSYFSSRSGGGRYFNPAKPPKPPVVAQGTSGTKAANSSASETPSESQTKGGVQTTAPPTNGTPLTGSNSPSSAQGASGSAVPSSHPKATREAKSSLESAKSETADAFGSQFATPLHTMSAKDFKMHHFFSLHRPLLLINQPTSLFRTLPENHPLYTPLPLSEAEINRKIMLSQSGMAGPPPTTNIPDSTGPSPSDTAAFIDADAEAARQLTRALTMNKAGATVSWEAALSTLGLDVSKDVDRVGLSQQFEKEWEDVLLDSTKRKRRKKMKKHKLKKRRRATRSERMRLK